MNELVITLLVVLSVINGSSGGKGATFCELPTISSVFNIGKTIHFLRCGQVWTYDPSLYTNSGRGGFTRDYSWFNFARKYLSRAVFHTHKEYHDDYLIYTGFTIQGLECVKWWADLNWDCVASTEGWNRLSMIASNKSLLIFRYDTEISFTNDSNNPLGLPSMQIWDGSTDNGLTSIKFWPDLTKLAPRFRFKSNPYPNIAALLYLKEEYRLFVVISEELDFKCITHTNMKERLFDRRKWPKDQNDIHDYKWAPAYCFVGNIVGMFVNNSQTYIVGRVHKDNREFEDQVYRIAATDNHMVEINVHNIEGHDFPHNLRTFFGCPVNQWWYKSPKRRSVRSIVNESPNSPLPPPNQRRRRSAEEKESKFALIWRDIVTEVREDWIKLSFMSLFAVFLIYRLLKYF